VTNLSLGIWVLRDELRKRFGNCLSGPPPAKRKREKEELARKKEESRGTQDYSVYFQELKSS